MMLYLAELTGVAANLEPSDSSRETFAFDNRLRQDLIGRCEVDWRDGLRRTLDGHFPGTVRT
jgi:hypothetical protein